MVGTQEMEVIISIDIVANFHSGFKVLSVYYLSSLILYALDHLYFGFESEMELCMRMA